MTKSTALVVYNQTKKEKVKPKAKKKVRQKSKKKKSKEKTANLLSYKMPFEQFISEVDSLLGRKEVLPDHKGYLQQYPVIEVIACGMYTLLISVASKKLNKEIKTDLDITFVAERVDRLINAGLVISFTSIKKAAQNFVKNVYYVHTKTDFNGKGSFLAQVQKASAQFFAKIFKDAHEYGQEIIHYYNELSKNSRFRKKNIYRRDEPELVKIKDDAIIKIYWIEAVYYFSVTLSFEEKRIDWNVFSQRLLNEGIERSYFEFFFKLLPGLLKRIKRLHTKLGGAHG